MAFVDGEPCCESDSEARQGRQSLAHGVSPGSPVRPPSLQSPPPPGGGGGRKGGREFFPGLEPWATIFRPYQGW